ncbi:cAMP-dependent protein kinase inhibitor beta-like [Tropilaelaps mercedesae]|uniref:cAMP-dependent protein kinase inhibitor beta-like n=1 Tax=Tropilaelaps mercedesae TaxID=418985 RepID=A0A1V9X733_9ACAR|nr:cAMP-dependent protein kinase inhibitor beta-like [Tropilaelaps mercedesae]
MASGSPSSKVFPSVDQELGATATMNSEDSADGFLKSGRTGRRNALPDILDEQFTATGTGDLPCELGKLSCSDQGSGSSSTSQNQSSTSAATN